MTERSPDFDAVLAGPAPAPGETLVAASLVLGGFVAVLVALSNPLAVAVVATALVAGRYGGPKLVRWRRTRRRRGRAHTYCLPGGEVCLEV